MGHVKAARTHHPTVDVKVENEGELRQWKIIYVKLCGNFSSFFYLAAVATLAGEVISTPPRLICILVDSVRARQPPFLCV